MAPSVMVGVEVMQRGDIGDCVVRDSNGMRSDVADGVATWGEHGCQRRNKGELTVSTDRRDSLNRCTTPITSEMTDVIQDVTAGALVDGAIAVSDNDSGGEGLAVQMK